MASLESSPAHYDVLIVGAGQAADPLAKALADAGKSVALAERKYLGGSCANFGCTPTKAVIASARVAHLARRGAEFGITIPTVTPDLAAVLASARAIVMESRDGLDEEYENNPNPRLLRGHARFEGKDANGFRVRVGDAPAVTADTVVLDTGTRSTIPPIPGLDTVPYIIAETWLDQNDLPEHLVILGSGYIGIEMAQFYRRMGSRVTVIDRTARLMEREDAEISAALQSVLEGEGIVFKQNATAERAEKTAGGVRLTIRSGDETREIAGSHLFVAVGRTPNTSELGLETIGLTLEKNGIVPVDERLQTLVSGVYAVGDIRGGPMFTHTSWDDFRVLHSQLTGDGTRTTAGRNVPYAVFTDPQIGRVGMTEAEAREAGKRIKTGRYDVKHNGHMRTFREKTGFIKIVVDAATDRVLGASLFCDEAAELVHLYELLMNADAPYTVLRDAIITHPTRGEAAQGAVEGAGE